MQTHKEYYNVVGRKLDARLEALGGRRVFQRGEGDASSGCIDLDFESWQGAFLEALTSGGSGGGSAADATAAITGSGAQPQAAPAASAAAAVNAGIFAATSTVSSTGAAPASPATAAPPKPLFM